VFPTYLAEFKVAVFQGKGKSGKATGKGDDREKEIKVKGRKGRPCTVRSIKTVCQLRNAIYTKFFDNF